MTPSHPNLAPAGAPTAMFDDAHTPTSCWQPRLVGRDALMGAPARSRAFGLLSALGLHAAAIAIWFLSASAFTHTKPPEPVTLVSVAAPIARTAPDLPQPPPPKVTVPLPRIDAPLVQITEPAPAALSVAPAQSPVAPPPPANTGTVVANYQARLLGHLNRYKRYPQTSRARREQGVSFVFFSMNREGRVLNARLRTSSGFTALDAEGVALIERAQPLPKPPPEVPGDPLEMVVPVEFFLR